MRSCSSPVLVQQTAEQVVSMQPALLLIADDRQSGGRVWRFKSQRSVRTVLVVVTDGHCYMCCERALSRQTVVMRTRRPRPATVPRSAFAGFCFPPEVIMLAVRWYLRFGLSYRDVEELLAERGIEVDHVTVYRWVQRFTPLLAEAARPCRHAVGNRWQVDET
jgi:hypothetical protein